MAYNLYFIITGIDSRFKNLHTQVGNLYPFQPADQFFRFSAEHTAANHFYPAPAFPFQIRFNKHLSIDFKILFVTLVQRLQRLLFCLINQNKIFAV